MTDSVLPKLVSYKKKNIAKEANGLMKRAVKVSMADIHSICLELLKMKEVGISYNHLKKTTSASIMPRELDFGVVGKCIVPDITMSRGNILKAKKYIQDNFPGVALRSARCRCMIGFFLSVMPCFAWGNFFPRSFFL